MRLRALVEPKIIVVYIITLSGSLGSSIIIPLFPKIESFFDYTSLGITEALFILIATISLFFWGYIADRIERRMTYFFGSLIILLSSFLIVFSPNIIWFVLFRFLMGFGLGSIGPVIYSMSGDLIKAEERSTVLAGVSIVNIAGSGIAILFGGILGQYGWQIAFFVIASFNIVGPFLVFLIQEPTRGQEEPELKDLSSHISDSGTHMPVISIDSLKMLFHSSTNIFLAMQGIFALIPSAAINYFLISYLTDTRYAGLALPLLWGTIFGLGSATGRIFGFLFWGYLGDHFQYRYGSPRLKAVLATITMGTQSLFMGIAFLLPLPKYTAGIDHLPFFFFTHPLFIVFMSTFFLGAFIGGGSGPNRAALSYEINPPEVRGSISSVFNFSDQLGASLGLFFASLLFPLFGYGITLFILVMCGYIFASIVWSPVIWSVDHDAHKLRTILRLRAYKLAKSKNFL